MPRAAWKPATSSASVNGRARITSRPCAAAATASSAVKTTSPLAAPGEAATPRASTSKRASGSKVGCSSASSAPASIVSQRLLGRQQALVDGVDGEAHGGLRRALGAACLQHVQAAALDGELDVLHVAVVRLERAQDLEQLRVRVGQLVGQLVQRARRAHAGDDVLALRVEQEVAARLGRAGELVAREGDARRRAGAAVAEDHLLDVDRRAPVVGDVVDAAVGDGAVAEPGVEDGADRQSQLLLRVLRERLAGVRLVERRGSGA